MYIGFAIGLFIVSYLIQLLLCFKAKSTQTKLIPFYFGLAFAFLGLLIYAEIFGDMSTGSFVGNMHILSAIIVVLLAFLFGGMGKALLKYRIDFSLLRQMIVYSRSFIVNDIAWFFIHASDKFMLERMKGSSDLGIYTAASKVPLFKTS